MEEKKPVKVNLGTVVCMTIVLILVFALIIVCCLVFVSNRNKIEQSNDNVNLDSNMNNSNENITNNNVENTNNNTIEFKPANYVIKFDSNLLGEKFESSGNQIKECDYEISFLNNNEFTIYMNFGNFIKGTYSVSSDNIINCIITSFER
ncbi:MAG: hypothetical protein Q4G09_05930 [Clostridia bacterium]|nr:hypothetical protein [Clostridia bacterium]